MSNHATSEDITYQTRWLLERMERDQDERRGWQEEWRAESAKANSRAGKGLFRLMIFRGIIEFLILVGLVILVWRAF
jgi:hypothetical protein